MMSAEAIFDLTRAALWSATLISLPLLAAALAVGLVIGLLQALTSVQEMTLTFVPKLGVLLGVFWVSMDFMTAELSHFFQEVLLPAIIGA